MKLEHAFDVAADQETVWTLIRDPARMVPCVPGCEECEQVGDDEYRAKVTVSVGPIKASFNLTIDIVEEHPPTLLVSRSRGEEGSRASVVKSDNELRLEALPDGGTRISYAAEVEISGRLGRYGAGMMKKIATRLAGKFEESFQTMAEAEAGIGTGSAPEPVS
jgi:carbon monoxide dehydrogenase subunit G